jgi:hypothetical protein
VIIVIFKNQQIITLLLAHGAKVKLLSYFSRKIYIHTVNKGYRVVEKKLSDRLAVNNKSGIEPYLTAGTKVIHMFISMTKTMTARQVATSSSHST